MDSSIDSAKKVVEHIVSTSNNKKRPAVSSVNYLMMLGYIFGGWEIDNEFLDAKIATSSIYVSSILPKIDSLASIILHGDEDVLAMKHQWL